ncbi:MAG: hypothetical protein Q8881_03480 [Sweet potato little leaf phytoplasma]|nr:hypothetical protein [Sweet potato little leaf phytoplasma]
MFPMKRLNFRQISPSGTFPTNGPAEFSPNFAHRDISDETAEFSSNFALGDVSDETAESIPPNFALVDVSPETAEFPSYFALGTLPTKRLNES